MLKIKILALKKPQRYALKRTVLAAWQSLEDATSLPPPHFEELTNSTEIMRYTPVTVYPSLVINEQLVCVGRFPKKEEVISWLKYALQEMRLVTQENKTWSSGC